MTDISGPHGSISSASAALQSSLANRLQARSTGSILYRLTWKERVTPSGRAISALRASAARISASEFTSWPTPTTRDHKGTTLEGGWRNGTKGMSLNETARLSGWPSPTVGNASGSQMAKDASATGKRPDGSKATVSLPQVASFAGWPTAMAGTPARNGNNEAGSTDSSRKTVWLAGWPTTTSKHAAGGEYADPEKALARVQGPHANDLRDFAKIALPMRLCSDGRLLTGSTAGMVSGGRLNPEHSRWLMRIPPEWASCAPTETLSTLKRRRNSAQPSAKSQVYDL